jgi:hypothetical protein
MKCFEVSLKESVLNWWVQVFIEEESLEITSGFTGLCVFGSLYEVVWFTVVRSQSTFRDRGEDSFVLGKKFPYLPI